MSLCTCMKVLSILNKTVKSVSINRSNVLCQIRTQRSHQVALFATSNGPEKERKEIYYGVLTPQIKAVKLFSLSTSVMGVVGQPLLYNAVVTTGNVPVIIAAYSFVGFFTVVTPFLLHFITKKYVTHLFYIKETDSYIARTCNFFCFSRETEFKTEDIVVPDVPGMFTTLHAKGRALFLEARLFDNPEHYARLMGYDKPIDLKLCTTPPLEKK